MNKDYERLVGTDHDELLKLRFSRFRSTQISKQLILEKTKKHDIELEDNVINEKAKGISSAIDSALNYLEIREKSLNARILSRYYAFLQLTIAEEVASVKNKNGLKQAQKHTEQGHGLNTINRVDSDDFVNNYYCYIRKAGHFFNYLKHLGINTDSDYLLGKRLNSKDNLSDYYVATLADLFRRIPELQDVIEEYIGQCSLSLNIGLDSIREHEMKEGRREAYSKKQVLSNLLHLPKQKMKSPLLFQFIQIQIKLQMNIFDH